MTYKKVVVPFFFIALFFLPGSIVAEMRAENSAPAVTTAQEKKEESSEKEKKTISKPLTIEEQLTAAAQSLGFAGVCALSAFCIYTLLRNGMRELLSNPYDAIPPGRNTEQEYLDRAWRETYFVKPFRIAAVLGMSGGIFWVNHKLAFYKKAWNNVQLLLKK